MRVGLVKFRVAGYDEDEYPYYSSFFVLEEMSDATENLWDEWKESTDNEDKTLSCFFEFLDERKMWYAVRIGTVDEEIGFL
jgi:hypothetical protein